MLQKISNLRPKILMVAMISMLIFGALCIRAAHPEELNLVALGSKIFFDRRLSADGNIACSSCHTPEHAYADPNATSTGARGRQGSRNAPSLLSAATRPNLFWDGRRASVESMALDPFVNPAEMGLTNEAALAEKLHSIAEYRSALTSESGNGSIPASVKLVRLALAAYLASLPRKTSTYDVYRSNPQRFPLSSAAKVGLRVFTHTVNCAECHTLDTVDGETTDDRFHPSSVGWEFPADERTKTAHAVLAANFSGLQLGTKVIADRSWSALGRFAVTHDPADIGAFRTPSLRNVGRTAPYMHDGSVKTLEEAVDIELYYRAQRNGQSATLTAFERAGLLVFLRTLDDVQNSEKIHRNAVPNAVLGNPTVAGFYQPH